MWLPSIIEYNEVMSPSSPIRDTSQQVLQVQLEGFRRMSPAERISRICALSQQIKAMSFAAIRRRHPGISNADVRLKFIELTYGIELAKDVRRHLEERRLD